jgi:type IV pilus assembly protein PilE
MFINQETLKSQKAFTLIELMIVVAIIGILAGVAYPSYQNSITNSRRADTKGALMGLANAMERHFTENNTYLGAAGTNATPADTGAPRIFATQSPVDGGTPYYNLTISAATSTSYTLRATPIGTQANDGILEMNHTESRGRWDRNNDGDFADANEDNWD